MKKKQNMKKWALLLSAALVISNLSTGSIGVKAASDKVSGEAATVQNEASSPLAIKENIDPDVLGVSEYRLWVGATPVTSANKDNIPGLAGGSASYDPATKTLTLNNAVIDRGGEFSAQDENQGASDGCLLCVGDSLTIKGKGTLMVSDEDYVGILFSAMAPGTSLTIDADLTIVAEVGILGILDDDSFTNCGLEMKGGNLNIQAIDEYHNSLGYGILMNMDFVMSGGQISMNATSIGIATSRLRILGGVTTIATQDVAMAVLGDKGNDASNLQLLNGEEVLVPEGGRAQLGVYEGESVYGITDASGKIAPSIVIAKRNDVTMIFDDIKSGAWYVKAVQYVYDHGIMVGTGSSFKPSELLTREQFVQVLYTHSSKPSVDGISNRFPDVAEGKWYTNAVLWGNNYGVTSGYGNGNFGVGDPIAREQLAQMLYKYAALKGYDTSLESGISGQFMDAAKISNWAHNALDWAVTQGIMSGKGNSGAAPSECMLDPLGNATRAECAAMMMKLLEKNGQ